MHDRGIDLIFELSGEIKARIGVQIKCDNDLDKNLSRQIDNTLANYDVFHINYLIIVFCGDYTNKSHKTKIRQEIARIEQKTSIDEILLIEAPKAVTLFSDIMSIPSYLDQFRKITKNKKFSMQITGFTKDNSGFPIIYVESKAFIKNQEAVSLAKAYLLTIIGLASPDILELGFMDKGKGTSCRV